MIKKKILNDKRIRRISGGFGFIPHRFLTDGFFTALDQHQLLLYPGAGGGPPGTILLQL